VVIDGGRITREVVWVCDGQRTGVVLSSLARIIWATTIDVIGVLGVEGIFEALGLIQIELLFGLVGGSK
jgi:hypothetical protein